MMPDDPFERDLAAMLKDELRRVGAQHPTWVEPDAVAEPRHGHTDRRWFPWIRSRGRTGRSGPFLAVQIAAMIGIVALVAVGGWRLAGTGVVGPSGSIGPTAGASLPPSATPDLGPGQYANDPRMLACEQAGRRTIADVLYAWTLAHGSDYRANLLVPVQPDLASATESALVVVFKTGDATSSSGGNPPLVFPPPPGSRTVCVGLTGTSSPILLSNLPEASIVLPPAAAPIGVTAAVAAALNQPLAAMTWDAGRNALWVVTWVTGPTGQLARIDADGTTKTWPLPNGPSMQIQPEIQAGLQQPAMPAAWYGWDTTDVVVDGQGEVWVVAGYGLVRFDPGTGRSQLRAYPEPDMTQVYTDGGSWLSAIGADGDGVLIARHGDHVLTRVDESMGDAGSISLPASWTDLRGIAVLGDRILAGGPLGLGSFDRIGTQMTISASSVPHASSVAYASLRPLGQDRVAILPTSIGVSVAMLFDANARPAGTVTLPMEALQGHLVYNRLVAATDWSAHVWYGEWDDEQPVYVVEATVPSPH